MKKNILNIFVLLAIILMTGSCTKDWEEMNMDPNNPADAPLENILTYALRYTGDAFYDDWQGMNNFLSYSGHVTKIYYIDEARYNYRDNVVNNAWRDYYQLQMDLSKMREKAVEAGLPYTEAVAMTYSAFLWQMMTDQWGDIPYTEAISAETGDVWTPAYDNQEYIYNSLFALLEEANNKFNLPVNEANPEDLSGGDYLFHGDFSKWQKFCNSLRLRMALRVSGVDGALAQENFSAVLGDPAKYPVMDSRADDAFFYWEGSAPYKEPWAENLEGRDDHGMAKTLIDTLLALGDPRISAYAQMNSEDAYLGATEGGNDGDFDPQLISRLGTMYREDPAGFSPYMRYAEVEFIKAEVFENGWVSGDAAAAYSAGIAASFEETGMTADLDAYLALPLVTYGGDAAGALMQIHKQKWLALYKQGQELWAEFRRTDFPPMNVAAGSVYPGHNTQPMRYPYPVTEKNLNSANYGAVSSGIVDHFWGKQMWWDTRTGKF